MGRKKKQFPVVLDDEVLARGGGKPLSTFRKIPKASEIDEESAFAIAVYGAANWIRATERNDWDTIAEKAVELYLSGITDIKTIAAHLNVRESTFKDRVDIPKIKAFVDGEVARRIYELALNGNEKMLKLVAERRLGWGKHDTLQIDGEIKLRPILNMSLLTKEEEELTRKGLPLPEEGDVVDATFSEVTNDKEGF